MSVSDIGWTVTRDELDAALADAEGEAVQARRLALADQDATVHARWEESVSTANLLTVYRRRAEHVREIGLPCLGFDETVERLESTPLKRLRLAAVQGTGGCPWCVVFVAPDGPDVVASLAVTGPMTLS